MSDVIKYGCHCDMEEGMAPDDCVMDTGRYSDCIYAADNMTLEDKLKCKYWKPINETEITHGMIDVLRGRASQCSEIAQWLSYNGRGEYAFQLSWVANMLYKEADELVKE